MPATSTQKTVTFEQRKGITYMVTEGGGRVRFKPWLGDLFAFAYDHHGELRRPQEVRGPDSSFTSLKQLNVGIEEDSNHPHTLPDKLPYEPFEPLQ